MMYLANHTADDGRILLFYDVVQLLKAKRVKRALLVDRSANAALCLLNFNRCHCLLSSEYFFHRNTTMLRHCTSVTHLTQSLNCSLYKVVRVGRTLRLSENVLHTSTFKYGTHCTTSHNSSTFRSRKDEDFSTTKLSSLAVGHCTLEHGNLNQILLSGFYALGNSGSNFAGLTKTATDNTLTVTDYNDCSKSEGTTTFGYFNNAIDSNQSIFQLFCVYIYSVCHINYNLSPPLRAPSATSFTRP